MPSPKRPRCSHVSIEIPYIVDERPDTGLTNVKLGIWLFLASEVMLFGALFSSYVLLRLMAPAWPVGADVLNVPMGTFNTVVLIGSSVTMVFAYASLKMDDLAGFKKFMAMTIGLSFVFMVVKAFEYSHEFDIGNFPSTSTYRRRHRELVFPRAGLEDVGDEQDAVHEPDRSGRALLALCRSGLDLPVPGAVFALGSGFKVLILETS